MFRILSVSRNVRLLITRNDALAIAGFSVVSPRNPLEAPLLLAQQHIDAVVIGHSVEPLVRKQLISSIRKISATIPILFVYAAPQTTGEPMADLSIDVTEGPQALIAAMQKRVDRAA